ncbi:hypothetical protein TNCT_421741 [Trichonephila clavata]|uniref:Uncharacterized protein n=1 Tax=Trichonephila clavata TaxID=2740835 RepID=A0A8X6LV04_TRICU|nr:hypothetical protein TNCT_421741 [Trichonephila clavata]
MFKTHFLGRDIQMYSATSSDLEKKIQKKEDSEFEPEVGRTRRKGIPTWIRNYGEGTRSLNRFLLAKRNSEDRDENSLWLLRIDSSGCCQGDEVTPFLKFRHAAVWNSERQVSCLQCKIERRSTRTHSRVKIEVDALLITAE